MSNPIIRELERVERRFSTVKRRFQNAMKGRAGRAANRAERALRQEPGPPVYPLRWKSERQRRAFFATDGFGGGIPHERKGDLAEGTEVVFERTEEGGVLSITNPSEVFRFVQGEFAQPFHQDTGWVQIGDVLYDFFRDTEDLVTEVWYAVGDPLAEGE